MVAYNYLIWKDKEMFDRIVSNPEVLGGKPCIRGTRISVEFILELLATGGSRELIVSRYPQLRVEDVEQAILYAAQFLKNEVFLDSDAV